MSSAGHGSPSGPPSSCTDRWYEGSPTHTHIYTYTQNSISISVSITITISIAISLYQYNDIYTYIYIYIYEQRRPWVTVRSALLLKGVRTVVCCKSQEENSGRERDKAQLRQNLAFTIYSFTSKLLCTNQPSFPPPRPPALPILVQYECPIIGQYTTPLPTSRLYAIHNTILVITISCKGQVRTPETSCRFDSQFRRERSPSGPPSY